LILLNIFSNFKEDFDAAAHFGGLEMGTVCGE
jgi:hypothetical protein